MIDIIEEALYDEETGRLLEYPVGECECGEYVILDSFTCTCEGCGKDYNGSGQELAPRKKWGAETDEQWFECL